MSTVKKNLSRRRREKRRAASRTEEEGSTDHQSYPPSWTERVATEKRQRVYQQQNNIVKKEYEKTLQTIRRERRTFRKDMRKAMALLRTSLSKITTTGERGKSRRRQKFVHFPHLPLSGESGASRHDDHTETKLPTVHVVGGKSRRKPEPKDPTEEQKPLKEDGSLPVLKRWVESESEQPPDSRSPRIDPTSFPRVGKLDSQVFITKITSDHDITSAHENVGRNKSYKSTPMLKEAPPKTDQTPLHTVIEEPESNTNDESDEGDESVPIAAYVDQKPSVLPVAEAKTRCRTWPGEGPVEMFPGNGYTSDMMTRLLQNGVLYTYRPPDQAPLWPEPDLNTRLRAATLRSDALVRAGKDGGGMRAWLGLASEQEPNPMRRPSIGQRRKSIVQLRRESLWSLDNYE
ncbi:hypothetical protein Bbelb_329990 [Branchiostoma belcheri]|nr:hypothetical protein Bbelb_329990 [Branchiostoma belcheri]